ncbi:hypothetical protein Y1Q_0004089 [Alligator mississippiensis]|uniref:Uncharacterized protein n=1 Tax=Alligator mississippiensis TaxID=8496 RepID=A0A151PI34_ALLMI|nr:hypothetical protein Y1Q_0004089 [Alligator mississippiensis]
MYGTMAAYRVEGSGPEGLEMPAWIHLCVEMCTWRIQPRSTCPGFPASRSMPRQSLAIPLLRPRTEEGRMLLKAYPIVTLKHTKETDLKSSDWRHPQNILTALVPRL